MDALRGGSRTFLIFVRVDNSKAVVVDVAPNDLFIYLTRSSSQFHCR